MQLTPSVLTLAACGLGAFSLVGADAHCDTRDGTKH